MAAEHLPSVGAGLLKEQYYEKELKETEKGVSEMCRDMEEIYGEGMESGRLLGLEEGERKKARETVLSLAELKMPEEQISQIVKMPLEVVQGWIEESLAI